MMPLRRLAVLFLALVALSGCEGKPSAPATSATPPTAPENAAPVVAPAPTPTPAVAAAPKAGMQVWALVRNSDPAGTLEKLVSHPAIDGIVYYTGLIRVAPAEGQFDWSSIDKVLATARAAGKPVKLCIAGGRWIPEWIYTKGAKKFEWSHTTQWVDAGTSKAVAPEPWDPIYLGAMKAAAQSAGQRYANDPTLVEVQITGPALANGLEMNLNITPEQAKAMGFTPERLATAWKSMVDAYADAFPTKKLSLALHNMVAGERREDIAREVRDYAFQRVGNRLELLVCYATHADWFKAGNAAVDIWAEANGKINLESQLIDIYSAKKQSPDLVATAMRQSYALGGRTMELFSADLLNDTYLNAVAAAREELTPKSNP